MKFFSISRLSRALIWAGAAMAALTLSGCASVTMPAASATPETIEKARAAKAVPFSIGKFALAPGMDAGLDKSIGGLRGSTLVAASGSYSQQLRDQLAADLQAAGLLKEGSDFVISGLLTENQLDAAISKGTAKLSARFALDRGGKRVLEKELSVQSEWESSFVGAIALPMAINQYSNLYRALSAKLIADLDFRKAMAP